MPNKSNTDTGCREDSSFIYAKTTLNIKGKTILNTIIFRKNF